MSNRNDQHRLGDFPRRGDEKLREQIVQTYVRRWELDVAVEEVLRQIVSQCSVRAEPSGKFSLQFPAAITLNQQMKIARPLRQFAPKRREHLIRQLQRLEIGGERMADMVRRSLANPLVALVGKSPFDGYLTVCRDSEMHWGIVRALQHLRDAITVTREPYFTDPTRYHVAWRLSAERITPAMLHRVEGCLRDVGARALHEPACNRWLKGLQGFFDAVKEGTCCLPAGPATAQPTSAMGEAEIAVPPSIPSPQPVEGPDDAPQQSRGLRDALRALRECLLPQYLDLAPEDFAALCRWDQGVGDFAQQLGSAVERFSVRCLSEMRQKFLEGCAARACGSEASPADAAEETGKCVRLLAEEAASLRSWLERELPQEGNSVGRRLLTLTESSLVSGLFFLFLQQRFAELFGDDDGDGPRRGAETRALAARRTAIVQGLEASLGQQRSALPAAVEKGQAPALAPDVAKCCEAALAALLPLLARAARAARAEKREARQTSPAVGKLRQRVLSAEGSRAAAAEGPLDCMELVEYEPGAFPPLRCRYFSEEEGPAAAYGEAQVCRFSRRGGAALSPDVAIPVAVLFGQQSRLARAAGFLDAEANRHLAECRELAGTNGIRECLPYLESHGAQWARIQIRAGDPGGHVTLLALPAAAMAMSDDFAENISVPQALQQAREASPTRETLLRAVEAHWREKGIVAGDYSLCVLPRRASGEEQDEEKAEEQRQRRRTVRRFLNQKARWPLEEAEEILKALGIVIEPKGDGAPHGKVRFNHRHHTLSSKLLKDGQVYATYLYEWIRTLGQERLLADLLEQNDPRLAPYMRKAGAGEE